MLKLGNININKAYLGGTEIKKMYLGNTIVFDNTAPTTYDPDFQAWIDYNILQGHYITSDTVKLDAANQYVIDSKADGTWQGKDVEFIFAWNDLQMADASLVCMKRLVKATVYGGMTYTLDGWEGNGVDGYIATGFIPTINSNNYTQDDAGKGALVYKAQSYGLGEIMGISESIGVQTTYNSSQVAQRLNSGSIALNSGADLSGIGQKSHFRDNSEDQRLYNKAVEMNRTSTSSGSVINYEYNLFRRGTTAYTDLGLSGVFFSKSMSQSQNESIRTNLNTYLTTIGLTPIA